MSLFEDVLNSKLVSLLPYTYQFNNDFGGGNLRDDIYHLNYFCSVNDFNNAVSYLQRLVYYLVQHSLWSKEVLTKSKSRNEVVDALESKLNFIGERLNKNISDNEVLMSELKIEKDNLSNFISIKNQELSEISNLLPAARNHSEEIARLLTTSTDVNQQIIGLLNQQNSNLELQKEKINEEKKSFESLQEEFKKLRSGFFNEIKESEKKNFSFDALLIDVEEKSKTFRERLIVLNEIIGKEGAVKLFSTFNDRKKELDKPVLRWTWIVFVTGSIALVLIVGLFTNFFGYSGTISSTIDWQYLLINSLKSVPIMIVLYFAIKQYVRERNFQEEYAFRSAIALTVQAYGDIAGTKKEELIYKAVENIFNTPTMMKERSNIFSIRTKMLSETIKELNETIKTLKP